MRNILILADLAAPFMLPRIAMLRELPYKKYILHSANNIKLSQEVLENYRDDFIVLEHRKINNRHLRYLYSFFYTLYLLIRLNPKLIVVHWASRLYQNLLLALWGGRVIVHIMGGEINKEEDCYGKKKFFTSILLKGAKIITGKTEIMKEILLKNFPFVDKNKVKILSWGVEQRFFENMAQSRQKQLQKEILGQEFEYLFFSVRRFIRSHFHKEILQEFIRAYGQNPKIGLLVSALDAEKQYLQECEEELHLQDYPNIIMRVIPHYQMHEVIKMSNCVISYKLCDGISQSLMETVASKRWIISKALPNHAMLLQHKQNAYLVDSIQELSGAFEYCLMHNLQYEWNPMLDYSAQKDIYLGIVKEHFNV